MSSAGLLAHQGDAPAIFDTRGDVLRETFEQEIKATSRGSLSTR